MLGIGVVLHCHVFVPEALRQLRLDANLEPQLVDTPEGPFKAMWACGAVLRELSAAVPSWMDALERGTMDELPAISPTTDAILHHLTDGQYNTWYLKAVRQKTLQDMQQITQHAQRPLRVNRLDVLAVGPHIRERMSTHK